METTLGQYMVGIWVGLFGLAVGSFLNVAIYRLPLKKGMVFSRSACPDCGQNLRWYQNIPLFSYLCLRGRCAFCHERISARYPLVELLNGGAWAGLYWYHGLTPALLVWAALVSALIVIFFIDLDHQIIPDSITLPGIGAGLAASFLPGGIGWFESVIGILVGGGSLYLIAMLGDFLFKKESMGGGDIKMAAMLGAFLGWQKVILVFLSAAVIALVVSVALMAVSSKLREHRTVPFGPFLAAAAVISLVYGDRIIEFYLTHLAGIN